MDVLSLLKEKLIGKKLEHTNTYGRTVQLVVEDVKIEHHTRQITPDTPQNDWWGETQEWDTLDIYFVDGSKIQTDIHKDFKIVD